jgi:hypothetical protein
MELTDEEKEVSINNSVMCKPVIDFLLGKIDYLFQCRSCKALITDNSEFCLECTDVERYKDIEE